MNSALALLRSLRRGWLWITAGVALAITASLVSYLQQPILFQSHVEVRLNPAGQLSNELEVVQSPEQLAALLHGGNAQERARAASESFDSGWGDTSITIVPQGSTTLFVTVRDTHADRAASLANALVDAGELARAEALSKRFEILQVQCERSAERVEARRRTMLAALDGELHGLEDTLAKTRVAPQTAAHRLRLQTEVETLAADRARLAAASRTHPTLWKLATDGTGASEVWSACREHLQWKVGDVLPRTTVVSPAVPAIRPLPRPFGRKAWLLLLVPIVLTCWTWFIYDSPRIEPP